jgi:preprotein translocase subunit SecA
MLRTEVMSRVPEAVQETDGPWKLLAWLEQIQPPLQIDNLIFPSYTLKLLLDYITGDKQTITTKEAIDALSDIAKRSLLAEEDHLVHTVSALLDQTQARLKTQIDERVEAVDTFFEGITITDDDEPVNTRQLADELTSIARISLRLSAEQLRALRVRDEEEINSIRSDVISQIETNLVNQALTRLVGSIERRLEEPIELNPSQVSTEDWDLLADQILDAIQLVYNRRRDRLIGSGGQIITDLESALARDNGYVPRNSLVHLLMLLPQGARAAFDKKTHRRIVQRTTRLSYTYFAAQLLENRSAEEISESVLSHLEQAQSIIHQAWGLAEWMRISASSITELDETTQNGLKNILDEEVFTQAYNQPLTLLNSEQTEAAVKELGRQMLTEIYRQLLLQVITELWIEYLTQMEALRVSIGLEAYAQRDPLVQYKNRAFELFQNLLRDMRIGVVSRMFTYRPRDLSSVQTTLKKPGAPEIEPEVEMIAAAPEKIQKPETQQSERSDAPGKKRRRHRR